jgi:hypothetical protein
MQPKEEESKKRKLMISVHKMLITFSPRDRLRIKCLIPMVDTLQANLKKRALVCSSTVEQFSFFVEIPQRSGFLKMHICF